MAYTKKQLEDVIRAYEQTGSKYAAAEVLGISEASVRRMLRVADADPTLEPDPERDILMERLSALNTQNAALTDELKRLAEERAGAKKVEALIREVGFDRNPTSFTYDKIKESKGTTGTPTLMCSDWHWDEVVDPQQIDHVNKFNRELAEARCRRLFETAVELLHTHMRQPKYDGIVAVLGGDIVSGIIHEDLEQTNEFPMGLTIMSVVDNIIGGLELLAEHFPKVYVPCVTGNHGRMHRRVKFKNRAFESFDWLIYQFLARHFNMVPEVSIDIPGSPDILYSIYDTRYLLTHGDQFSGGHGHAGVFSPIALGDYRKRKRQMTLRDDYDIMLMGHFHQYIHTRYWVINGTLKGYDEYAYGHNFEFEPPNQAMWITHPRHGVTARWPIFLEERHKRWK